MSLREEQCKKVCRILDNVLANRPTERDSLIVAVRKAFAEPKRETANVSVGISKGGVTMWYECDACGEPVDPGDIFCSRCGRELIHE